MDRKQICIVDGQGGGIGANLIKYLREFHGERYALLALGTNVIATSQMMKTGTNRGASGENAVIHTVAQADLILESVDVVQPEADDPYRLINIVNEQKIVKGRIRSMHLVEHKIVFEALT